MAVNNDGAESRIKVALPAIAAPVRLLWNFEIGRQPDEAIPPPSAGFPTETFH
jgi:hypothetical protein